jgi:hypothetical protein
VFARFFGCARSHASPNFGIALTGRLRVEPCRCFQSEGGSVSGPTSALPYVIPAKVPSPADLQTFAIAGARRLTGRAEGAWKLVLLATRAALFVAVSWINRARSERQQDATHDNVMGLVAADFPLVVDGVPGGDRLGLHLGTPLRFGAGCLFCPMRSLGGAYRTNDRPVVASTPKRATPSSRLVPRRPRPRTAAPIPPMVVAPYSTARATDTSCVTSPSAATPIPRGARQSSRLKKASCQSRGVVLWFRHA